MYLTLVFLPLINSIFCGLFGKVLGYQGTVFLGLTLLISSVGLALCTFFEVCLSEAPCYINTISWVYSGNLNIWWGFTFDSLTCVMLVVVCSVSCLVHLYSTEYMKNDPHFPRFFSYLSLFTFFMLILVTANNLVQLFLGWEGVGLCSYLLINFWHTRIQANKAAIKAMVLNRIGDIALAFAIFIIYLYFGTTTFSVIFSISYLFEQYSISFLNFDISLLNLIGILFAIGAAGKSAQFGLHTWLPDAMEGPTPVSALIHAATMVTAGIFLLIRFSPLLEFSTTALIFITILGALTSFFAAATGLFQNDLKRVIAYSTCSQLGYMMFACGISGYHAAIFHLYNHAFFKALLFLTAGCIIHALNDEQDMRKMGGLLKILPFSYCMILIGSLALTGFPFLSGFYSKDFILELCYATFTLEGHFAFWMGSFAAFLTAFYSLRLLILTFFGEYRGSKRILESAHEAPLNMILPLIILGFLSIFIGYFSKEMMVGLHTNFWGNAIFFHPKKYYIFDMEFIPIYVKLFPTFLSFFGMILSIIIYINYQKILYYFIINNFLIRYLFIFFNKKWFFDKVYNDFLSQMLLINVNSIIYNFTDKGFLEYMGPSGFYKNINSGSILIKKIQNGKITLYTTLFLINLIWILILFLPMCL